MAPRAGRHQGRPPRLSQPALETLAIIAYRQPITRAEVEQIRGVNVDGTMQTIMERGLVESVGRAEVVGRPPTYGTTALFLEYFGLRGLEDLPAADELRRIPITKPPAPVTVDPGLATTPPEQLQLNEEGKMKNEETSAAPAVRIRRQQIRETELILHSSFSFCLRLNIPEHRKAIDKLDTQIVRLLDGRSEAERALGYVELYGSYSETEARFRMDRTVKLFESLDPADQAAFCFDPAVIDWPGYIEDVHLPSIVEHARVRTTAAGKRMMASREERSLKAILSDQPRCAAFDLENTLIASNVVESYAWLATRHLERAERVRLVVGLLAEGPKLLRLDRRDRSDFLRAFYRRYEDAPVEQLRLDSYELFSDLLGLRAFPEAIARVRRHRALGHRTLLITGALDFVVEPLRPLFDEIVCASMAERDGKFTGELTQAPPTGEARAILLDEFARAQGLSLADTVAYADSTSDLPMLEAAGFPVVINPEAKLAAIARRRGWFIEHWERAAGGPRRTLAIATRRPGLQTKPASWLTTFPAGEPR